MSEDSKAAALRRADNFHAALTRMLGRYRPDEFCAAVAELVYEVLDNRRFWPYYPLHFLMHCMEANCAYAQPDLTRRKTVEVTRARINGVIDYYKSYRDPYLEHALDELEDIGYVLLAIAKQQFAYQQEPRGEDIARSIVLFVDGEPLPKTAGLFAAKLGFSMRDWIFLCLCVLAHTKSSNTPHTGESNYLGSEVSLIPKSAVRPFLNRCSFTPTDIAQRYRSLRAAFPSYLYIFLPSVFLERPLIDLGGGDYLAVHPGLLVHNALDGLYEACCELDAQLFHMEFGESFQRYVRMALGELGPDYRIFTERDMQQVSEGRTSDFAVESSDCILLVECKSVRYSAMMLTEGAIKGANSTTKIAESLEQLHHTAMRVRACEFDSLFRTAGKNVLGMTVTFGRVFFANRPDYVDRFIRPKMQLPDDARWPRPLDEAPQVLSAEALEDMIAVVRATGISISQLFQAKLSQDYDVVGDWDTYLPLKYGKEGMEWYLPSFRAVAERFMISS